MGTGQSNRKTSFDANSEVNFDHFQILRAIGKGSFGKVCIVQKRNSKLMFAMKYMNKAACIKKDAVRNVFREMDMLRSLEHPFLVNLWYTFQDEEDMFMVVDLLLGGDLRYHIQQDVRFDDARVKLYICEISLALDYLRTQYILHRDIKPDNILLDESGHVHITDFNIATHLKNGHVASSLSGTRPYMAPEVFACSADQCSGYSFPVDWWSLGICAYEMLCGKRPYEIHSSSSPADVVRMYNSTTIHYPSSIADGMRSLLKKLLHIDSNKRLSTFEELKQHSYMENVDFDRVLRLEVKPNFIPPKDHLNCDPTFELEEMIIESKPLHKKKKRLAKQNSKKDKDQNQEQNPMQQVLDNINKEFKVYNREKQGKGDENHSEDPEKLTEETIVAQSNDKDANNAVNTTTTNTDIPATTTGNNT